MRAYIDKSNLISLFQSYNENLYEECIKLLKSQFDLFFTFDKVEIESNEILQSIFLELMDGVKKTNEIKSGIKFPERPLKNNFHNTLSCREDLTAIYLLNEEKLDDIKNKGYLLIGAVGQEIQTISKLIFEDYQFVKNLTPKSDMKNWDIVGNQNLPCTDIIITDRYVFYDSYLLDNNLHYLLKTIGGNYHKKKLNIVIFTSYEQEYIDSFGKKQRFIPDWESLKKGVKTYLKNIYDATSNVTLITLRRDIEHDRIIFTNYNNHHSGDSLNYFDSKWNYITNGRHYTIFSHAYKDHLNSAYCFIEDMQEIINRLIRVNNKTAFVGDRKSNFLKFPD